MKPDGFKISRPHSVHACPPGDSGVTPCCGRTPFELSRSDRLTLDGELVSCGSGFVVVDVSPTSCDCDSYNLPNGGRSEVSIDPPAWSDRDRPVLVDACIVESVRAVWAAGFWTLGSCCGHNARPPSLILGENEQDYAGVSAALGSVDDREWELLQWQLVSLITLEVEG